jgi:hypothetical protein
MVRTGKSLRVVITRSVAAAAIAVALGACSSGSNGAATTTTTTPVTVPFVVPTTTSTLPPRPPTPAQIALNRAYLLHAGADLVKFETETKSLVTPTNPSQFTCDELKRKTLPALGGPAALTRLAAKVPDKTLAYYFNRDILTKNLLIAACSQFETKLDPGPMAYTRNQTATLFKRLAQFLIVP